jgi:hypothetical protein
MTVLLVTHQQRWPGSLASNLRLDDGRIWGTGGRAVLAIV